nr:unnamed protein product [Digitaria exilis]
MSPPKRVAPMGGACEAVAADPKRSGRRRKRMRGVPEEGHRRRGQRREGSLESPEERHQRRF